MNLNPNERAVLNFLAGEYSEDFGYHNFGSIERGTSLDRKVVRRACRSLKRKGLTEFCAGLWDDDGQPAGSGYAATREGVKASAGAA